MNRKMFGLLFGLLAFADSAASGAGCDVAGMEKSAPNICGIPAQGGMLYGQIDGWDVYADDEKISNGGVFVLGLGRDAPAVLNLKFCDASNKSCQAYSYNIKQRKYQEQKISVPDRFVEYPKDVADRIDRESEQIASVRGASVSDRALYFMEFSLPDNLKGYKVSGVFGSRRMFNGVAKSPHKGVDFAAPAGAPVYPVAAGTVILADDHYMNGKIVMVSHGHGIVSAYLHLSEMNVRIGDNVAKDKIIGRVGSTGRSSGAHLHLGMYWDQIAIDPGLFILKGGVE